MIHFQYLEVITENTHARVKYTLDDSKDGTLLLTLYCLYIRACLTKSYLVNCESETVKTFTDYVFLLRQ